MNTKRKIGKMLDEGFSQRWAFPWVIATLALNEKVRSQELVEAVNMLYGRFARYPLYLTVADGSTIIVDSYLDIYPYGGRPTRSHMSMANPI